MREKSMIMNKKEKTKVMREFKHFTMREVFRSCSVQEVVDCISTGSIDSLLVLVRLLDDFREEIECPVTITSSYRSAEHNRLCGGSPTSQHLIGEAIDFYVVDLFFNESVSRFREFLCKSRYKGIIGQVIIYPNFIHVAIATPKHPNLQFYEKRKFENPN